VIQGQRVSLRPTEEGDLPQIRRWMNHPEIWRYMDYERPVSLKDVEEDLERSRKEGHPFTILVGDRPIGRIGLNQFRDRDRICAFYMFIGEPAFWGKGYARDAAMTLLSYAFDRWDLWLIELWTLADNNRAISMYQRCGFVAEATVRERSFKEGHWVDRVVMSVRRDEFQAARRAWNDESAEAREPAGDSAQAR
jgi:RimJ/RimL family protein N-acetyltransferase